MDKKQMENWVRRNCKFAQQTGLWKKLKDSLTPTNPAYPSLQEVETAQWDQISRWADHLPPPYTAKEMSILKRVIERFKEMGGWDNMVRGKDE
jgi:hypothetical protein